MTALQTRYILVSFLAGSLLGFTAFAPATAGALDKVRDKKGDRQTAQADRSRADRSQTDRSQTDRSSRELPEDATHPNPQQQANLQGLRSSLGALAGAATAADAEIRDLAQDLQDAAIQPPDPALTQALASDLAEAMADASLAPREIAELTQAVHDVLNSAGLSQAEIETLKNDVESILVASGVDRSDVQAVVDDLQAIYDASHKPSGRRTRQRR